MARILTSFTAFLALSAATCLAQDAMLSGKMGACGMHLTKAMQAEMGK